MRGFAGCGVAAHRGHPGQGEPAIRSDGARHASRDPPAASPADSSDPDPGITTHASAFHQPKLASADGHNDRTNPTRAFGKAPSARVIDAAPPRRAPLRLAGRSTSRRAIWVAGEREGSVATTRLFSARAGGRRRALTLSRCPVIGARCRDEGRRPENRSDSARVPTGAGGADVAVPRSGLRGSGRVHRSRQLRDQHPGRLGVWLRAGVGRGGREYRGDRDPDAVGEARPGQRSQPPGAHPRRRPALGGPSRLGGSGDRGDGDRPRRAARGRAGRATADGDPPVPGDDHRRRRDRAPAGPATARGADVRGGDCGAHCRDWRQLSGGDNHGQA